MQLAKEVHAFASACEHLLAKIAMHRPLSEEEGGIVEYYCKEMLQKALPSSVNCSSSTAEPSSLQKRRIL